jgi:hypothetical protein
MNKILIVGHPSSRYRDVEALLNDCGMKPALPSRHDALTPPEIDAMLLQAHAAPPVSRAEPQREIRQLQPGPIWNGVALDLMLGNLEQPLWGWADPDAAVLLDYWKSLDPSIAFIMVYDNLENILQLDGADLTEEEVRRRAAHWVAYNEMLLHFYLRNTERSLLVHAQQVRLSVNRYLQQLRARIKAPLDTPAALLEGAGESESADPEADDRAVAPWQGRAACAFENSGVLGANAAREFLANVLTSELEEARSLYEHLQSAASLPLSESADSRTPAVEAWRSLWVLNARLVGSQNDAAARALDVERLERELSAARTALSQRSVEADKALAQAAAKAETLRQDKAGLEARVASLQSSNAELEKGRTLLASRIRDMEGAKASLTDRAAALERELVTIRTSLETRAEELQAQQREAASERSLLLAQLHTVQQEFERCHTENRALKRSLRAARRALRPAPTGAADRIREQLDYRLGAAFIRRARSVSGLLFMPWVLLEERRRFFAEQAARLEGQRPPLSAYRDAHEAELVKKELPYRIGSLLRASARSPAKWMKLPFALRREVLAFRLERQANAR